VTPAIFVASICDHVFPHLILYRRVRVYTFGPDRLYSCFTFHTSTIQFWNVRLIKALTYSNSLL